MRKIGYICFLLLVLIACALPFIRADHVVAFKDMQSEVKSLVNTKDFKAQDKKYILKQYELKDHDYEKAICYGVPSAMEVNELTVIKTKNEEQRSFVKKQLQNRIDRQYKSFLGYAPKQADILKHAILYERGDYVIMIIHKDAQDKKATIDALF